MFGFRLSLSVTLLALGAMAIVAAPRAGEQEGAGAPKAVKLQTTCPVGGEKISKASYADHEGHRVYFCCDDCKGKFTKEPKKFATAANAQLFATKQFKQVKCPLTGKDVKEGLTVKVAGQEVGLCCAGCEKKVTGMEEKDQVEALFGEKAFEKSFELAKKKEAK